MKTSNPLIFCILWAFARCAPEPPAPLESILAEASPPQDTVIEFQIWANSRLAYRFGRGCIAGYDTLQARHWLGHHLKINPLCLPDSVIKLMYPVELRCYLEGKIWYQAAFYARPTSDFRPYQIVAQWADSNGEIFLPSAPTYYYPQRGQSVAWQFPDKGRSICLFVKYLPENLGDEISPAFLQLYRPFSLLSPPEAPRAVHPYRYLEHPRYRRALSRKK